MKPSHLEKQFGKKVALCRRHLGLTQAALAQKLKVSRVTIANIENGHQRTMLEHALKLRILIGVEI